MVGAQPQVRQGPMHMRQLFARVRGGPSHRDIAHHTDGSILTSWASRFPMVPPSNSIVVVRLEL